MTLHQINFRILLFRKYPNFQNLRPLKSLIIYNHNDAYFSPRLIWRSIQSPNPNPINKTWVLFRKYEIERVYLRAPHSPVISRPCQKQSSKRGPKRTTYCGLLVEVGQRWLCWQPFNRVLSSGRMKLLSIKKFLRAWFLVTLSSADIIPIFVF